VCKIHVKDVEVFETLVGSLLRIVPSCKFIIDDSGIKVRLITESKGLRGFFKSDSVTCDKKIELSFGDLSKFYKSLALISNIEDSTSCELDYDNTFVSYHNRVKFKLKTIKEDVIERFISPTDITTKFDNQYTMTTSEENIKKVLQCVNIVDDSDSKIYFIKSENGILCEIDNKLNKMSDSIGLPICDNKHISGEVQSVVQLTLENFRAFGILSSDNIKISITQQKVIVVQSGIQINNYKLGMRLYCSILKG